MSDLTMAQACLRSLLHTAIKASLPFLPLATRQSQSALHAALVFFSREAARKQLTTNQSAAHTRDEGFAAHTRAQTTSARAKARFHHQLPAGLHLEPFSG